MSLAARDGYEIIGCSSPSGNPVIDEDYPHWRRILLEDKLQNSLMIHCRKRKEVKRDAQA